MSDGVVQEVLQPLPERQLAVAVVLAVTVLVAVVELVRRRKLREEYSWLWVATAAVLLVLALEQRLLVTLSQWVGSSSPVNTLYFGALLFLLALVLQFSVRLSRLTLRQRTLGQRMALLEAELQQLRRRSDGDAAGDAATQTRRDGAVEPPARGGQHGEVA